MKYLKIQDNKAIIAVIGSFDLIVADEIREAIAEEIQKGIREVVFDFENTIYVDSSAFGVLVKTKRKLGQGMVKAINMKGDVLDAFRNADLIEDFS